VAPVGSFWKMAGPSAGQCATPFTSREKAQRYVDAELAGEAEIMARGDVGLSARSRFIRETDPKVWAKIERIEEQYAAADDDDARVAAHIAADTWITLLQMTSASLEAEGKIESKVREDGRVYRILRRRG
jgi:hypothetical protein